MLMLVVQGPHFFFFFFLAAFPNQGLNLGPGSENAKS